jgi:hypothetical protein
VFNSGPTKLTDADIEGWECSAHVSFLAFPSDWTALAITLPEPGEIRPAPVCGNDIESGEPRCGQAYVLIAGQGIVAKAPNLSLTPEAGSSVAGGTHTVTANVHKEGKPIVGSTVTFVVTELNAGVTGTCTTSSGAPDPECKSDEKGEVNFTYTDTHGVGKDTIVASVTLETAFEEPQIGSKVRPSAAVIKTFLTTERATATQEWTAPVPPPPPPPAAAAVLSARSVVKPTGSAHLASSKACVASSGYVASVSGKGIASVTYTLDGHKLKTVTHANHGAYALLIHVKSGHQHHLSIHVVFTSASHTKPVTLHKTLARCAARVIVPRFTG